LHRVASLHEVVWGDVGRDDGWVSIWSSVGVDGPDVAAVDDHDGGRLSVDVATSGRPGIRVGVYGDGVDVCALLGLDAARLLYGRLAEAIAIKERTR
jgi:hypothetical protein